MFRVIVLIVFGMGVGYFMGFKDARRNEHNVVERVVGRVGGSHRGQYQTDVESRVKDAER
ncbi:MAG: hypothetical protein ACREON_12160 [Gemmatimonadaceae bacterium]